MPKTNPFFPAHPCDLRCIPESDTGCHIGWFRYFSRRLAMTMVYGVIWCLGVVSVHCSRSAGTRLFQLWCRLWIRAAGIRIEVRGPLLPNTPVLLAANHMSYFDLILVMAAHPFVMTSAQEVADDPTVGRLLRNTGTLFVSRENLSSVRDFVAAMTGVLRAGHSVVTFPEGRIRCSAPGGPFAPAVMQAAIDAGVPVRPVLMWCELADGTPTSRASWLGTESLRSSLRRLQRIRGLTVRIRVLPDIDPAEAGNRNEMALLARGSLADGAAHLPVTCISASAEDRLAASCPSAEVRHR